MLRKVLAAPEMLLAQAQEQGPLVKSQGVSQKYFPASTNQELYVPLHPASEDLIKAEWEYTIKEHFHSWQTQKF